jgi:hypothetical protein
VGDVAASLQHNPSSLFFGVGSPGRGPLPKGTDSQCLALYPGINLRHPLPLCIVNIRNFLEIEKPLGLRIALKPRLRGKNWRWFCP